MSNNFEFLQTIAEHGSESVENEKNDASSLRRKEILEELNKLSPAEIVARARMESDTDGTSTIDDWLSGVLTLDEPRLMKLIDELPSLCYERKRKEIASKLGIRTIVLDKMRSPQAKSKEIGQGREITFRSSEPWPERVNGAELLNDLAATYERYVSLPEGAADALALWTVFTYIHDLFQISPILCMISPEKRCGKTTLLTVMNQLVSKPLPASNITPAALFRTIEQHSPTLLVDEADTFINSSDDLRGILNSGHTRAQAYVIRTAGEDYEARIFTTWAPKAIALIGRLPPTLDDRSIVIELKRKTPNEKVERLRLDSLPPEIEELRCKLTRLSEQISVFIQKVDVQDPDFLNDRAADNWRPLLMIAEAVTWSWDREEPRNWRKRALYAAQKISWGRDEEDIGSMLLNDIWKVFREQEKDRLSSAFVVEQLVQMEERPWPEYWNGRPITPRKLASLLKRYGISPRAFRIGSSNLRGYMYSDLEDAVERYCATNEGISIYNNDLHRSISAADGTNVAGQSATHNISTTLQDSNNSKSDKEIDEVVFNVADTSGNMKDELLRLVETRGYVCASVYNDKVVVVAKNEEIIPEKLKDLAVFSIDEVIELLNATPEQIDQVIAVKKIFEGQIVN